MSLEKKKFSFNSRQTGAKYYEFMEFIYSNFYENLTFYLMPYIITANGIRSGMEKMQRAFEIYPYCAMSLNYLANHFFFTGQHFLVEQLTETALSATTHGPTKSHSFYNLARSYHSKVDIIIHVCIQNLCTFFSIIWSVKIIFRYSPA